MNTTLNITNQIVKVALLAVLFFALLFFMGCSDSSASGKDVEQLNSDVSEGSGYAQFNITVLLDLSDRIDPKKHPIQKKKDIEAISAVVRALKQNIKVKGAFNTNDRFKVVFYPELVDGTMLDISARLNTDFSKLEVKNKKQHFEGMETTLGLRLAELYDLTVESSEFTGSDIFNFFKDRAKDVTLAPGYKNIVVVITDGYMFWEKGKMNYGNRFSYIGPNAQHVAQFRNAPGWEEKFEKENFGFININRDLSDLNVLVLELDPVAEHPQDYDIMKKYWEQWFDEMHIPQTQYKVVKTGMPLEVGRIIEDFIASR